MEEKGGKRRGTSDKDSFPKHLLQEFRDEIDMSLDDIFGIDVLQPNMVEK